MPSLRKAGRRSQVVEPTKLEAQLVKQAPTIAGPLRILSSEKKSGHTIYSISASRLVPVDDKDPKLREISIAVPVTGEVEVDGKGTVARVSIPDVDDETTREARAFTRSLIASGSVRGMEPTSRALRGPGPPRRPTHEVRTDRAGRKLIVRAGFDIAGAPRSVSG
jgi:hypothetical protein